MYLPLRSLSRALAGPSRVLVAEAPGPELVPDVRAAPPLGDRLRTPRDDLRGELRVANSLEPRDLLVQLSSSDADEEDEGDEGEGEGDGEGDHGELLFVDQVKDCCCLSFDGSHSTLLSEKVKSSNVKNCNRLDDWTSTRTPTHTRTRIAQVKRPVNPEETL